jgi:hypothetical protein
VIQTRLEVEQVWGLELELKTYSSSSPAKGSKQGQCLLGEFAGWVYDLYDGEAGWKDGTEVP